MTQFLMLYPSIPFNVLNFEKTVTPCMYLPLTISLRLFNCNSTKVPDLNIDGLLPIATLPLLLNSI